MRNVEQINFNVLFNNKLLILVFIPQCTTSKIYFVNIEFQISFIFGELTDSVSNWQRNYEH
jgi:hypothetical protein